MNAKDFDYFKQLIHEQRPEARHGERIWLAHNAEHLGTSGRTGGVNHITNLAEERESYFSQTK